MGVRPFSECPTYNFPCFLRTAQRVCGAGSSTKLFPFPSEDIEMREKRSLSPFNRFLLLFLLIQGPLKAPSSVGGGGSDGLPPSLHSTLRHTASKEDTAERRTEGEEEGPFPQGRQWERSPPSLLSPSKVCVCRVAGEGRGKEEILSVPYEPAPRAKPAEKEEEGRKNRSSPSSFFAGLREEDRKQAVLFPSTFLP